MGLFSQAIWWAGNLMLVCMIWRLLTAALRFRYPYFLGYVLCVTASTVVRLSFQPQTSRAYSAAYWITEFVSAVAGFGVMWEIYAQVLGSYCGVRKMAHGFLGFLLSTVLAKAAVEMWGRPLRTLAPTTVELERNLRVLQALLLMTVLALVVYYRIPLGRNVRWLLRGYGFYIACTILALTVRSQFGARFELGKDLLQRLGWCATLAVWCVGMWSYAPNPAPSNSLGRDYERVSENTRRALGSLRAHVTESWRI